MIVLNTERDLEYLNNGTKPMFFITCLENNGSEKNKYGWPDFGSMRTFGFYTDLEDARKALNENYCDMRECVYDYAIIEKIYPGIHPWIVSDTDTEWYQYDESRKGFFLIDNPKKMNMSNFALG